MRLSLVEDYDDNQDEGSSPSQDSFSLDIAPSHNKQTASYTNLFDTSQPTPVGATYQQAKAGSPRMTRPKDLRYDRSPRPIPVTHLGSHPQKPPLAMPEDFSPTDSSKPRTNINSPGAGRSYSSKPPTGQNRPANSYDRGQGAVYTSKNNGYPARSVSEERFRDTDRNRSESNHIPQGYNRYPDERTRRSTEFLDQRGGQYHQQGNSRTLPNQNRYVNSASANQNQYGSGNAQPEDDVDYKRPMSFVKALEMSEVMQNAREKDKNEQVLKEEKKKSVYDSAYEISV